MSLRFFQNKMLNISTRRSSFTISVVCGIFASFSIAPRGVECYSFTCNPPPPPVASVQELVHRSEVVFEGKLQEKGREYDINQNEREILYRERAKAKLNLSEEQSMNRQFDHLRALDPNATSDAEPRQVRVRVHQVWEIKAGGLEKNSVVSLVWYQTDNCFQLSTGTRYMFFMEPTNDTSVFIAVFPPVETKRAVRKDVSKVLCQECAEPKLKGLKSGMVEEGRKTLLKCEIVAGNPTPNIKWYKNGIELVGKNKPKDIRIKKKKQGKISELHLRKASQSHTGTYKCEATNNLGKVSTTANLTVNRVPTSTTPPVKTSSHVTRCSESEKNYCVNGGECFTLEVTPGSTKFLCRCPNEFTGDRCQNYVMANFYKHLGIEFMEAEELYQKRVLTITGICIALLVVGIMCVVAYCKTKKQRKKLHDRLRQSLRERNAMASMANGPQLPIPPPDNLQLVNQYVSKNAIPAQHVIEKETETSFSTSQYTSSNHQSTTVTHTSSQCWSNGKKESVMSDNRSVLVMSSAENSRHGTPSHRGRLNATGGARDLSAYLKSSRETPDSYRDSPYSERYVSAVTTPTHTSSMNLLSPVTPSSPPSETSAPLTSLAASVPSVAPSPSGEEERPLLFISPPWLRDRQRQEQSGGQYQRNSAHYNHGLEDPSPPPSPLRIVEDDEYESTQEYDGANAATPQSPSDKLANGRRAKRTKASGPEATEAAGPAGGSNSESNSSESETEDERVGEDTPFLSIQIPAVGSLEGDSSRTNPALRLSPQDDLQARLANVMANQDPIAV